MRAQRPTLSEDPEARSLVRYEDMFTRHCMDVLQIRMLKLGRRHNQSWWRHICAVKEEIKPCHDCSDLTVSLAVAENCAPFGTNLRPAVYQVID